MLVEINTGTETLVKIGMFLLVQALVYLILSKSSNIFSKNMRSLSIKTVRSASIRRIMAALSDLPAGDEPSPSSSVKGLQSPKAHSFTKSDKNN
ncbi:hypothetical protein C5167_003869 [Papaver somniferum]|uniref:Uncharacterized protein n=1 Tax=Papaver somniferum TaxID=3469 RepID=A0A4Y7L2M9_PAPSO|nr:uncharacterized protein LOC113313544 [Papaver somniferum]RZC79217.1 hypothetical protein C5167_003869 [Papaver somniferum]